MIFDSLYKILYSKAFYAVVGACLVSKVLTKDKIHKGHTAIIILVTNIIGKTRSLIVLLNIDNFALIIKLIIQIPLKTMQKLKILLFILIPALLLTACSKESEDSILLAAKTKLEEAKKLDTENKPEDAKKAYGEAIELYKKFLKEYPASQKAPEVYSSIAKIYVDNLKDYPNAIKHYEELIQKHPGTKESKYGMFMVAFIYDEMLKDKEKAKANYQKFLDKYPKDEDPNEKMSESARMMLQMLDENRSIEDIIKNTQKDTVKTNTPKEEPKKDDVKKEDVKKDETKKEAPKDNPDSKPTDSDTKK